MTYRIFCWIIISLFDKRFVDANFHGKNKATGYTKCKVWRYEFWRYKNYITSGNHIYDYAAFFSCDCVEVEFLGRKMTFVDGVKIPGNDAGAIEKFLGKEGLKKYARYIWQDVNTDNKKARNANP